MSVSAAIVVVPISIMGLFFLYEVISGKANFNSYRRFAIFFFSCIHLTSLSHLFSWYYFSAENLSASVFGKYVVLIRDVNWKMGFFLAFISLVAIVFLSAYTKPVPRSI